MKNLPIKKRIEKLMELDDYEGVWQVKDKEMYVKLTSKLLMSIVKINPSDYDNFNDALEDTIACAKLYKRFVKEGLYHPDTNVVVCKDDEDNLTLMITMPELEIPETVELKTEEVLVIDKRLKKKLKNTLEKTDLSYHNYSLSDLKHIFNWGYDTKTKEFYAHDLHISFHTPDILGMAKYLGYKK